MTIITIINLKKINFRAKQAFQIKLTAHMSIIMCMNIYAYGYCLCSSRPTKKKASILALALIRAGIDLVVI